MSWITVPVAKALDTILGHCILRAMAHEEGGLDVVRTRAARGERKPAWGALHLTVKVTPRAMRVATFIVLWAAGMREAGQDEFSITEYMRRWDEDERQAYRVQAEFRELWPEFRNPNELARQIVKNLDGRIGRKGAAKLPLTLQVEA
jgi:hypothetical protein